MTTEYNNYKYCDSEDENSDIYVAKVLNYGNVIFEFFRDVADDVSHDIPGKGKVTNAYHY